MKTLHDFVDTAGRLIIRDQSFGLLEWHPDREIPELRKILLENVSGDLELGQANVVNFTEIPIQINGGWGNLSGVHVWANFNVWGVDVRGAFGLWETTVSDARIGVLLRHMQSGLYESHIYDCSEDHVRVMSGSTQVLDNVFDEHTDQYGPEVHKDIIQVVAANYGASASELLDNPIMNVMIQNNHCRSSHPESQGIMVSDGVLIDSDITGNIVSVGSTHDITLNRGHNVRILDNECRRINVGSAKHLSAENMDIQVSGNDCQLLTIYPNSQVDYTGQLRGDVQLIP